MKIRILFMLCAAFLLSGCASGPDDVRLLDFRDMTISADESTELFNAYEAAAKCWTKPDGQFPQFMVDETKTVRAADKLDLTFVYRDRPEETALNMKVLTGSIFVIQGFGPEREGPFGDFIRQVQKESKKSGTLKLCQSDTETPAQT